MCDFVSVILARKGRKLAAYAAETLSSHHDAMQLHNLSGKAGANVVAAVEWVVSDEKSAEEILTAIVDDEATSRSSQFYTAWVRRHYPTRQHLVNAMIDDLLAMDALPESCMWNYRTDWWGVAQFKQFCKDELRAYIARWQKLADGEIAATSKVKIEAKMAATLGEVALQAIKYGENTEDGTLAYREDRAITYFHQQAYGTGYLSSNVADGLEDGIRSYFQLDNPERWESSHDPLYHWQSADPVLDNDYSESELNDLRKSILGRLKAAVEKAKAEYLAARTEA